MNKIPAKAWVVVADGTRARMLVNTGDDRKIKLHQTSLVGPVDLDYEGPSGVSPPESTGQQLDEATFAKQLAKHLNAAALAGEFEHLVLVADPQTLGQMRPLLHDETVRRQVGELAKTMTNVPLGDIEDALS